MRKMVIGCMIMGNQFTHTKKVLANGDLNQSDSRKWDEDIDETIKNQVENLIREAVPEDAEYFIEQVTSENQAIDVGRADAYVAVPFGNYNENDVNLFDASFTALYSKNRPVVLSVFPYENIWSYGAVFYPYFVRDTRKIDAFLNLKHQVYISKDRKNLRELLAALQVKFKVNHSKALCIGEPMYEPYHSWNWGYAMIRLAQEKFGLEWNHLSSDKFLEKFKSWDKSFARGSILSEAANDYTPEGYDTSKAEKMYHIFREMLEEYDANVFTVNCLWSMIHNGCATTACYPLSKLNDEKIVSACEADITTMINMLIVSLASNSPAFMLNPYLFPEDNKLFVSHCTSPRKHSFDSESMDDFNIYSYYEKPLLPCGLQILKETGPVTVTGISHDKMDEMIVIRGNIVRNTAFSSCRTQVEIDVEGDIREITENYEGRHWAMVYGDQSRKIQLAGQMLGLNVKIF